jgi:hypothetical protein
MSAVKWGTTFAAMIGTAVLVGCGGSSNNGGAADAALDSGPVTSGGFDAGTKAAPMEGGAPSAPPITPLADNSAGKACTNDAPCGGGTCASAVMSAGGGGLGGLLGGGMTSMPAPGGYCTGPCRTNTDCGAGGSCVTPGGGLAGIIGGLLGGGATSMPTGQCQATCSKSSDCRDGYSCGAFMFPTPDAGMAMAAGGGLGGLLGGLGGGAGPMTCQPLPTADHLKDKVAGKACGADADCSGGTCATTMGGFMGMGGTMYPGGYCSGRCLANDNCGSGGVCLPPLGGAGTGTCFEGCTADADCTRDGYRCRNLGNNIHGCSPAAKPLPDNVVGNTCSSDATCGGGMGSCAMSLPPAGGAAIGGIFGGGAGAMQDPAPGGYCSVRCAEDADCGAGGACVGAPAAGSAMQTGTCFKRCMMSGDCRSGYGCELRGGATGAFGGGGGGVRSNVCAPLGGGDAGD